MTKIKAMLKKQENLHIDKSYVTKVKDGTHFSPKSIDGDFIYILMSDKNGTEVPTPSGYLPVCLREVTGQPLEYTHSSDGRIS
ncbi:MAG: hypothetical protein DRG30_07105 [Epsilonproteobacteria bacterium]|nr:MAG: hypothetical protein DRG30_07105 [Campylobacterota bacterium]